MVAHAETGNLYEMMEHLGIGQCEGALSRLSLRFGIALRRCEACTSKKECREWLDQAPPRAILAPRFCKNADILFELQCEEPGPRATG
jgi:hypothetical protein